MNNMMDGAVIKSSVAALPLSNRSARVMVIEDDLDLCDAISEYLGKQGIEVLTVNRGDQALQRIAIDKPDLIVLDVMLPGKDGFDVCRELRATGSSIPVMMLTARDEDFDRVIGLELGADDYLLKPIQPRVLLAHIKAMLRRQGTIPATDNSAELLTFGRLKINRGTRDVTLAEERIRMTSAEFDLLWLLAANAGTVMHREDILQKLRGLEYAHEDRSVDARLYRLRKRFGTNPEVQNRIKTVRPHGYMFSVEPW